MTSIFGASFAAPYSASKGGIVQLARSLASAWAASNIQVNAVLPGWIETDLTRQARKDVAGLHERVLARTPAGRWGVPADLAGIAVFFASRASDFVTGTAIPVDGGYCRAYLRWSPHSRAPGGAALCGLGHDRQRARHGRLGMNGGGVEQRNRAVLRPSPAA